MSTVYRIQEFTAALPARWSYSDVTAGQLPGVGCQVWTDADQIRAAIAGEDFEGRYEGDTLVVIEALALSRGALCWSVVEPEDVIGVREVDLFDLRAALAAGELFEMAVERLSKSADIEFEDTLDGLTEAIEETYARAEKPVPALVEA